MMSFDVRLKYRQPMNNDQSKVVTKAAESIVDVGREIFPVVQTKMRHLPPGALSWETAILVFISQTHQCKGEIWLGVKTLAQDPGT